MSAPAVIPPGVQPELGWTAIMKWFVTGGYAADIGPYATAALVVLATHADFSTGEVSGLSVIDIGKLGGMGKGSAVDALAALREVGWLDEMPRRPGQRARYRLRYRAGLLDADRRHIGEASWPYTPGTAREDRKAVRASVEGGRARPRDGVEIKILQTITVNQHVEAGGVGIVALPPPIDPDALVLAVEIIQAASTERRLAWWQQAREAGAPKEIEYRQISGWAAWIAHAVINHAA